MEIQKITWSETQTCARRKAWLSKWMSSESQVTLSQIFFTQESLQRIIPFLCNARPPGAWDPVTSTVQELLTGKLHFCLTSAGIAPFKGRPSFVFPYHMMTSEQKDFLRAKLEDRKSYCVCNDCVLFHRTLREDERLDPLSVLSALCSRILDSKVHSEQSVRVGVCNIILQRVQSVVPISRQVQQQLNAILFEKK